MVFKRRIISAALLAALICSILFGSVFFSFAQSMQMPELQFSEDQIKQMESAMNEFQNYIESLPKEERDKLMDDLSEAVKQEEEKMSKMSQSELEAYVQDSLKVLGDGLEEVQVPIDQKISAEESAIPIPELDEEDAETGTRKASVEADKEAKVKTMLATINENIKIIESFKEKLNEIKPSAHDLINKWIKKGYVQRWAGEESNWKTFNAAINGLLQRLYKLQDTDPDTGKYKYVSNPKENEGLLGQLEMMLRTLRKYEPQIEIIKGGKIKKGMSKDALKKLINYLVDEASFIVGESNKLIEKFDPEAKRIRLEEEKRIKEAGKYKKPKYPRRPVRVREGAGYRDYREDYGYPYDRDAEYPSYYDDYSDMPDYREESPSTEAEKSEEAAPEEEKKKEGEKITEKDKEKLRTDKRLNRLIKSIEENLGNFANIMVEDETWENLAKHVNEDPAVKEGFKKRIIDGTRYIRTATRKVRAAANRVSGTKDKNVKAVYTGDIANIKKEYQDDFNIVTKQISGIKKPIRNEMQDYFGQSREELFAPIKQAGVTQEIDNIMQAIEGILPQLQAGQQLPAAQQATVDPTQLIDNINQVIQQNPNLNIHLNTLINEIQAAFRQLQAQAQQEQVANLAIKLKSLKDEIKKEEDVANLAVLRDSIIELKKEFDKIK